LLVAKHRTGLWQGRYGVITEPPITRRGTLPQAIQEFIVRSEAKQSAAATTLDAGEININYRLLQVWDLLSLYICCNEVLEADRIAPVPTDYSGRDGLTVSLKPVEPQTIAVDPYPFDVPSLTANVILRRLPQTKFANEDELQAAYFGTAPQIATFILLPA
jgi:Protein of unknown function (DUF3891)